MRSTRQHTSQFKDIKMAIILLELGLQDTSLLLCELSCCDLLAPRNPVPWTTLLTFQKDDLHAL